jgi:hypothetical protein
MIPYYIHGDGLAPERHLEICIQGVSQNSSIQRMDKEKVEN